MYIIELTKENQNVIREYLMKLGITGEDLEIAMNSKICDLDYLGIDKVCEV